MRADQKASRHLRWELFESRINEGPPSLENIRGTPRIDLFIEPGGSRIGARIYATEPFAIPSPLSEVSIRAVGVGHLTALEISTVNPSLFREFYSLCCVISDRVQVDGEPVSVAVLKTLDFWATLIRPKRLLSTNAQVGLFGELLFLKRASVALGWERASGGWYGPDSEEHDFVLPDSDAEVKSTTLEQRIHTISSLQQLVPKAGRRLYLVSIQLTPADAAREAVSLPQLIANVLSAATAASRISANLIRERLRFFKWLDEDSDHYQTKYCLRNPIVACHVGATFPSIVPDTIKSLGAERLARIDGVKYSINVDDLGETEGTKDFEQMFNSKVRA